MSEGQEFKPIINIDLELDEKDLDITLVDEISKLEPFGASNPSPIFVINDFTLKEKTLMGEKKNHLRLKVQGNDALYTCVWWSHGDISLVVGDKLDVAFSPKLNTFRDTTSLQLIIEDIHSENLKEEIVSNPNEIKFFDHRNKTDILSQVEDYIKTSKLDIIVFAENQEVINSLKPYKTIFEKIVSRQNVRKADSIMFFDYPPSEECLDNIIKTVSPRHIHYMPCNYLQINEQNLLKTISGMVKFTCNNKNGEFDLLKSASFLSLTEECVEKLINILSKCNMIKITEQKNDKYILNFINNIELSQALHCSEYAEFKELLEEITDYKCNLDIARI